MRIAELSRTCGVSTPAIKYYIREGLLPAGRLTSSNQARYTEDHVHRLRLIRAPLELGGLSVAKVRAIVAVPAGESDLSCHGRGAARLDALEALATPPRRTDHSRSSRRIPTPWPRSTHSPSAVAGTRPPTAPSPHGGRDPGHPGRTGPAPLRRSDRRVPDAAEQAAATGAELLHSSTSGTGPAERLVVPAVLGDRPLPALRRPARTTATTGRCTAPATERKKRREPSTGYSPSPRASGRRAYERLTSSRSRTCSAT
nr:MerR family transcriptional regulator [Streptomyces sp. Wb2n-11]